MDFNAIKPKLNNIASSLKSSLLIIGTSILVIAAARNSLTWHLTKMWGLSHDFWQTLWMTILEFFNYDAPALFIIGTSLAAMLSFWSYNIFLLYLDLTGKPEFLQRYKIQEEKNVPVEKEKVLHCTFVVVKNQLLSFCLMAVLYPLMCYRGMPWGSELPTFQQVLLQLIGCIILEEFGFYYTHRLLHHPRIYKHVHKIHHEWTAPIAMVGLYSHPIEHIFSNVLPVIVGAMVVGTHLATLWLWVMLAGINTLNAHCGYHFPSFPSPEQHDFHHLKFNQCYGVLGILDKLHNTDSLFRASKNYQRHIMHFSLIPVKVAFPEDKSDFTDFLSAITSQKDKDF